MTIERAVQLLRRMGWECQYLGRRPNRCWEVWKGEPVRSVWPEKDVIDYALSELTKREDVMERVLAFANQNHDAWFINKDGNYERPHGLGKTVCPPVGFLQWSIESGMTDDELLGVE